ncbi:EamA family transporter [Microvirga pudoricolor]|uniref:EamA family transporter n=1 Tax=Microvirga pudoricolor TaxID=2778729 RepID=UPI00194F015A|nr:EamA family transporter [Microvirga pudoricolor]MBM6593902.1 EamA family transporter [Microvirga pudoricolor]
MPISHILLALSVTVIWGLSFVVIKLGIGTTPPLFLGALRFAFAAFPAILFIRRPQTRPSLIVAYGFFLGVAQFGLLFVAIGLGMPASLASVVMQAQVFFTILFAALLMGERPGPHQILGGIVACLGLCLIAWPRMTGGGAVPFLMTVAAACAWGVANIVGKRAGRIDMLGFIVWASLVAPLPLLGLSLAFEGPDRILASLRGADAALVGAVAYLAYPTTVFAFGIWSYLLSRHPAALVTPFALLVPVAGILGSTVFLGERMVPVEIAGGGVILAGLAINIFGLRAARRFRS